MRYWWVNQNQTFRHEFEGGYLWSPKRNANGRSNPFYDFMRVTAPGDIVFSFTDTWIKAIGIAKSHAYESPKPLEFGSAGAYWERIGWRVDVQFTQLQRPTRPKEHMGRLGPLLPEKYAPLRANGDGLQGIYLTELPQRLALEIVDLIGDEARLLMSQPMARDAHAGSSPAIGLVQWEEHQLEVLRVDGSLPATTREAVVLSRRGQGLFKQRVMRIEKACRVTRVDREEHLRASHCKPWRDSDNRERLDGENGLLLTPSIDHLFDRGFISFESNGDLLCSPVADRTSLARMGINPAEKVNVGAFSSGQKSYLEYHRESVFLEAPQLRRNRTR